MCGLGNGITVGSPQVAPLEETISPRLCLGAAPRSLAASCQSLPFSARSATSQRPAGGNRWLLKWQWSFGGPPDGASLWDTPTNPRTRWDTAPLEMPCRPAWRGWGGPSGDMLLTHSQGPLEQWSPLRNVKKEESALSPRDSPILLLHFAIYSLGGSGADSSRAK